MTNARVAVKVLKGVSLDQMREEKMKSGFKYVRTYLIFDIKMNVKFTRKTRLVSGGHNTAPPLSTTYSSVVTRECVIL